MWIISERTCPQLKEQIYSSTPETSLFIGKRSEGHISNYYLGEPITNEEVAAVQAQAETIGVDILNTRYTSPLLSLQCI